MGLKYSVNETFFDTWTPESAYVLGYLYADGSLEDAPYLRGRYIRVTSVDKESIERIKRLLSSQHTIVEQSPSGYGRKQRYLLRIGSHKLYLSLINRGLTLRKSLTMKFPSLPREILRDFVRGYFDGDGGTYLEIGRGSKGQPIIKKLVTVFTSGSDNFLRGLAQELTVATGVKTTRVLNSRRSFQLRYNTKDSLKLFDFLYKEVQDDLYLDRKLQVFLKYLKLRSIKATYPSG